MNMVNLSQTDGFLTGKEETIRPTTPVPSITVTLDNQSKAKPVSTDGNYCDFILGTLNDEGIENYQCFVTYKEKNRLAVASIIGVQSKQANTSAVIPTADGLNLRRSPVSPAPTTSRNRSPIKSVSTDCNYCDFNYPFIINLQISLNLIMYRKLSIF